jgi:hypothetical protein
MESLGSFILIYLTNHLPPVVFFHVFLEYWVIYKVQNPLILRVLFLVVNVQ